MASGIFIAVEGIDGAGKTTQVNALRDAFIQAGEQVVTSKEPTDGPWGQKIRRSASDGRMSLDDELEAFIRDRSEHVTNLIEPSLADGKVVILDRYFYSTIAYQGCRGGNVAQIRALMESRFPVPDVVYLIDTEPAVSMRRIADLRGDIPNEFEKVDDLALARGIFTSIDAPNICHVDGHAAIHAIHETILKHLAMGPLRHKFCAKQYGCDDPSHCSFRYAGTCRWFNLKGHLMAGIKQLA